MSVNDLELYRKTTDKYKNLDLKKFISDYNIDYIFHQIPFQIKFQKKYLKL